MIAGVGHCHKRRVCALGFGAENVSDFSIVEQKGSVSSGFLGPQHDVSRRVFREGARLSGVGGRGLCSAEACKHLLF